MLKQGDIANLRSLLSHVYKLFTKMLDAYQPREQAGFRFGYGTNDNLQVINHSSKSVWSTISH